MKKPQLVQSLSVPHSSHAVSREDISDFTVNASETVVASGVGEEEELVEPAAGDSEGAGVHESENFSFPWDEENSKVLRLSIRAPLSDESHASPSALIGRCTLHHSKPTMFDIAGISSITERGGFNVVVARGRIEFGDGGINPPWAQEFHIQLCFAVAGSNSHGTAGIFIRNDKDAFGVTCRHVAKSSLTIIQPSPTLLTTENNNLIQRHEDIEERLRGQLLEQDQHSLEKTHK